MQDDVKKLAQKIGPEFETVFDRNNVRLKKATAEMCKSDILHNGAGDRAKTDWDVTGLAHMVEKNLKFDEFSVVLQVCNSSQASLLPLEHSSVPVYVLSFTQFYFMSATVLHCWLLFLSSVCYIVIFMAWQHVAC